MKATPLVSVIIPSRNEKFLGQTVRDVLKNARGPIEIVICCDGYWDHTLPDDPRLHIIHKGKAQGMRQGINSAAAIAKGDFLMKLDGHCMVDEGFDVKLAAECDDNWVVVPRRYGLDAEKWEIRKDRAPVDAHFLSNPFEAGRENDVTCGLHGEVWKERAKARADVLIDDEMSSQGSCWFMSRKHWDRTIGPLDTENAGSFVHEMQFIGNMTWLSGGRMKTNKKVWYAHLFKGKQYGRGYTISTNDHAKGRAYCLRWAMLDYPWPGKIHSLKWLVERFSPCPTWPAPGPDLDQVFVRAREVLR